MLCSGNNINNELTSFEGIGGSGGPYQTFECPEGSLATGFGVTPICYGLANLQVSANYILDGILGQLPCLSMQQHHPLAS